MKHMKLKWDELIVKAIIVFIISIVFFLTFNIIPFIIYIIIAFCVIISLRLSYKKNQKSFFFQAAMFLISNLIAFAIVKSISGSKWSIDCQLYRSFFVIYIVYLFTLFFVPSGEKTEVSITKTRLFPERKCDLDRIIEYVEEFDVVGINGIWGTGKTFLTERMKEKLEETGKYAFINIELLTANLDELQVTILNNLDNILQENKVFSMYSGQLRRLLGEVKHIKGIADFLVKDNASYVDTLQKFKEELKLIDKKVIIIYEDIDRIMQKEVIKKIFSISEQISCERIKIIYQYDIKKLIDLKFDNNYLEKYIHYTVNITDVSFLNMLKFFYEELSIDEKLYRVEELSFLYNPLQYSYFLCGKFNINSFNENNLYGVGARKVKRFLLELQKVIKENDEYMGTKSKRVVIAFIYVKHFYPHIYNEFTGVEGILDTLKFEVKGERHTIFRLIELLDNEKDKEVIRSVFSLPGNKEILDVLSFFEFEFEIYGKGKDLSEVKNESIANITRKEMNEKKERIIRNLLYSGKSEYTDIENAVNKFKEKVLDREKDKQAQGYEDFRDEMYYGNNMHKGDNRTIFIIGIPVYISLFRAFNVVNEDASNWCKLIEFYFANESIDKISVELVETLNYCDIDKKTSYFVAIKEFNKLPVSGNMNAERSYRNFVVKYLGALSSFGYINTHYLTEVRSLDVIGENVALLKMIMEDMKKLLCELKLKIVIPEFHKDIDEIILFIDKNIEIVTCSNRLKSEDFKVNVNRITEYRPSDEFKKLQELMVDEETFKCELAESYSEGKIKPYEIVELMKKENDDVNYDT